MGTKLLTMMRLILIVWFVNEYFHIWCVDRFAPVPVLDLASLGKTAHKYFQQLKFKGEEPAIFIQSFSHRLA